MRQAGELPTRTDVHDVCTVLRCVSCCVNVVCLQVEPEELPWKLDLETLADAVVNLVRAGWPPSMLIVYDEVRDAV